jgi:hypothetical protein
VRVGASVEVLLSVGARAEGRVDGDMMKVIQMERMMELAEQSKVLMKILM